MKDCDRARIQLRIDMIKDCCEDANFYRTNNNDKYIYHSVDEIEDKLVKIEELIKTIRSYNELE